MITPFTADGRVDYEALGRMIDYVIEGGADSVIVGGTTGEPAQNLRVAGQGSFIQQVAWRGKDGKFRRHCAVDGRKRRPCVALRHQSTRTGSWFSLRGRPYLSSASRNGSGLNSSTV